MPGRENPPFHTLPDEDRLGRLRGLTNRRAGEDEGAPTVYSVEPSP